MGKLVLLSIFFAVIALPTLFARDRDARRGLKRAVLSLAVFAVLYWLGVIYLTPTV